MCSRTVQTISVRQRGGKGGGRGSFSTKGAQTPQWWLENLSESHTLQKGMLVVLNADNGG